MSFSPRTVLVSVIGLGLLAGLVVTAFRDDPIPVDIAEISRGALRVTVDAEGEARVRQRFDVNAPITGNLLRMPLEAAEEWIDWGRHVFHGDDLPSDQKGGVLHAYLEREIENDVPV